MCIKCASTLLLVLTSVVAAESPDSIEWVYTENNFRYNVDAYINPEGIISSRETGVYCAFKSARKYFDGGTFCLDFSFQVCSTKNPNERIQLSIADSEEILGDGSVFNGTPSLRPGVSERVLVFFTVKSAPEEGEEYLLYLVCTREKNFDKAKKAYGKGAYLRVPIAKIVRGVNSAPRGSFPKLVPYKKISFYAKPGYTNEDAAPLPGAPDVETNYDPYGRDRELFYAQNPNAPLGTYVRVTGAKVQDQGTTSSNDSPSFAKILVAAGIVLAIFGVMAKVFSDRSKPTRHWDDWESDELRDKKLSGDEYKIESNTGFRGSKDRYGRKSLSKADQEAIDAVLRKRGEL